MNQVNDSTNAANSVLSNLGVNQKKDKQGDSNELGQTAFLELMITQMNNQDPLSPQDNTEFIAQLAQFSSVEGLERLNTKFEDFSSSFRSNQALQASSLVGQSVSVPTDTTYLSDGGIVSGSANLEQSTSNVQVGIYNQSGELVQQVPMGAQEAGEMVFRWDGQRMEVNGELLNWSGGEQPVAPGEYRFEVLADGREGAKQIDTSLSANVNSVTLDESGSIVLNLAGVGSVGISEVTQFN